MSSFQNNFEGSSPQSSFGGASANGTPDTGLTQYTPTAGSDKFIDDDASVGFILSPSGTAANGFHSAFSSIHQGQNIEKDPFISSCGPFKTQHQLSPTASTFQPFGIPLVSQRGVSQPMVAQGSGISVAKTVFRRTRDSGSPPKPASPSGSHGSPEVQRGTFSTDTSVTRTLKVFGIYEPVSLELLEDCLQQIPFLKANKKLARIGYDIFIRTVDVRDAQIIYNHIKVSNPAEWSVEYIAQNTLAQKLNPQAALVSAHEGQVYVVAHFPQGAERSELEDIVMELLKLDGDIYAFQKQLATEAGTIRLIAEFSNVDEASNSVERVNGRTVRGVTLTASLHQPDLIKVTSYNGTPSTPPQRGDQPDLSTTMSQMSLTTPKAVACSQLPSGYTAILSPTGCSMISASYPFTPAYNGVPINYGGSFSPIPSAFVGFTPPGQHLSPTFMSDHFGSSYSHVPTSWDGITSPSRGPYHSASMQVSRVGNQSSTPNGRRQNAMRVGNRSPYNTAAGHHNVVDIARIQEGSDVRTTIMLRNIPNKIDQAMLKSIIDETSFGLYDFMYLRIDFANNCNVGYAFINFEDPYHIIDFVKARSGQRWNRYNSDKVAEVSYATIQGKDCLVQKFRNSSVMLESPNYRPKIYYTATDPHVGEEQSFPPPDNASKMRRSVENAEHVGLFAPRAGQHYRDEQRRRRSQYDRGTRMAEIEEFDIDEAMGFRNPYGAHYEY